MNILNLKPSEKGLNTIYYGQVMDIEDPTKQGRIKVKLTEVFGESDPKQTPWIYPLGYNAGLKLFNVPDLNTEVGVIFIEDFYTGFYGIGRYPKGEAKIFDEDYPNLYGFEDAQGNYFTVNKKTGEVKFHHLSGNEIIMDKEGNTKAKLVGSLDVETAKDINIKTSATVKVSASKVELGSGGKQIARVGDTVQVGDKTGSIISGGKNTSI